MADREADLAEARQAVSGLAARVRLLSEQKTG